MDKHEWKLFLTNLLNKTPELLDALTSDAMRTRLKGVAYNVEEIMAVLRENVQESAALITQCAADVLETLGEDIDLDAPQTREMSPEIEAIKSEIRQALTPSLTRE